MHPAELNHSASHELFSEVSRWLQRAGKNGIALLPACSNV
jgi:hypothetical protein